MKQYRLYGEFDGSPIAMKANNLYTLTAALERLKTIVTSCLWYSIYKRKRDWTETVVASDIIIRE